MFELSVGSDPRGHRAHLGTRSSGSGTWEWTVTETDPLGRLDELRVGPGSAPAEATSATTYRYQANGRLESIVRPNLTLTTFGYSENPASGWSDTSIVHSAGAAELARMPLTTGTRGNRWQQQLNIDGVAEETTYGYDDLDMLARVSVGRPTVAADPAAAHTTYGYDRTSVRQCVGVPVEDATVAKGQALEPR